MKLSEKIIQLRKAYGMTQEELAAACSVSRQSISKWEADIALPEVEKLLLLGRVFHVSMDVLLKDELQLSGVREAHSCGRNAVADRKAEVYEGILIKESVADLGGAGDKRITGLFCGFSGYGHDGGQGAVYYGGSGGCGSSGRIAQVYERPVKMRYFGGKHQGVRYAPGNEHRGASAI